MILGPISLLNGFKEHVPLESTQCCKTRIVLSGLKLMHVAFYRSFDTLSLSGSRIINEFCNISHFLYI